MLREGKAGGCRVVVRGDEQKRGFPFPDFSKYFTISHPALRSSLFPSVLLNNDIYTRCFIVAIHECPGLRACPVVC